ncbi:DUF3887 domain-containing protein [Flavobacterium oreochromis]|uniref:DUF3887 domain-containing protein n=1 Tax=Flavobacterium oreochromis TaxID=2906078 RepID=A0ABW8P6U6_9FLAO|nr:DUF3887 domain-containing protein [Flavobacterium oreochromis]OWP77915.1 hypothetical protein BWG23_03835 [Flavobacterium oreochromis]
MNKTILISILLFNFFTVFSQNQIHKSITNTFIQNFNNSDFGKIIQTFSEKMRNSKSKEYFLNFFSRVKKENGSILNLELLKYNENTEKKSQATYNGILEKGEVTIKITTDIDGQIIGLYILKNKIYL